MGVDLSTRQDPVPAFFPPRLAPATPPCVVAVTAKKLAGITTLDSGAIDFENQ